MQIEGVYFAELRKSLWIKEKLGQELRIRAKREQRKFRARPPD